MAFDFRRSLRSIFQVAYPATETTPVDAGSALLLFCALLPVPVILGGALRAMLRIPVSVALAVAAVLWLLLLSIAVRRFPPKTLDWRRFVLTVFAVALPMGLAIRSLDIAGFAGLPSTGGGDAGNHVLLQQRFLTDDPKSYLGFVAFYAASYVAEALFRANVFAAFRAAFYAVPVTVVLASVLAVALAHSDVQERSSASIATLVTAPLLAAVLWGVLLPALHRYQGDGFYPQVFGVVTLCLAWLSWGLVDDPVLRGVLLVISVVLYRYSYGLNLADLAFCGAALFMLDGREFARTRLATVAAGVLVLMMAGIGFSTLAALYPHHADSGGVIPADTKFLIAGAGLGSLTLVATSRTPALARHFGRRLRRLMDFSGAFGLAAVAIELLYLGTGHSPSYYFFKHGFHPAALVSLGAFLVTAIAFAECLASSGKRAWRRAGVMLFPLIACGSALWLLTAAMDTYRESFRERVSGAPPWKSLVVLCDLDANATIERVLGEQKKTFGGYLTPVWAEANFTNAVFGRWRGFGVYGPDAVTQQPGHCVFWQATDHDLRLLENAELAGKGALVPVLQKLEDGTAKQCRDYVPRWDSSQRRRLCHRCF